jgi:SET and MYND domain-containing protein
MPVPTSSLFEVRQTQHAGRAVFATQDIPAGTSLLRSSDVAVTILYREYLREVCFECFAYDRGRQWGVRDNGAGLAWCSETCKAVWLERNGGALGIEAHKAVEDVIKRKTRREEVDGAADEEHDAKEPTSQEVDSAWRAAEKLGLTIIDGRSAAKPTKAQARVVSTLPAPSPPVLCYLLSAVLSHSTATPSTWQDLLYLHPSTTPYLTTHMLRTHITAYHHLLSVVPTSLLAFTTPTNLRSVVTRDAHNSFGIRSLDDGGSEMFGHGIWPSGSYWNHSCSPNVNKRREGRTWVFTAGRDVKSGEELCITYLGGDEVDMDVTERREQLWNAWRFVCACTRCVEEDSGGPA